MSKMSIFGLSLFFIWIFTLLIIGLRESDQHYRYHSTYIDSCSLCQQEKIKNIEDKNRIAREKSIQKE